MVKGPVLLELCIHGIMEGIVFRDLWDIFPNKEKFYTLFPSLEFFNFTKL